MDIVQGGETVELHNRMILFTEQICQWIRDVIATSSARCIDETFPDGCIMPMNTSFTKQWVVQNTGIGAWPIGCILLCIDGSMTDMLEVTKQSVLKDETYIFCVPLRAPNVAGRARWECHLLDPFGRWFPLVSCRGTVEVRAGLEEV